MIFSMGEQHKPTSIPGEQIGAVYRTPNDITEVGRQLIENGFVLTHPTAGKVNYVPSFDFIRYEIYGKFPPDSKMRLGSLEGSAITVYSPDMFKGMGQTHTIAIKL